MEYRYSGEERVYVDRALVVSDGDVVDWAEPPADGHWTPAARDGSEPPPLAEQLPPATAPGASTVPEPVPAPDTTESAPSPAPAGAEHTEE